MPTQENTPIYATSFFIGDSASNELKKGRNSLLGKIHSRNFRSAKPKQIFIETGLIQDKRELETFDLEEPETEPIKT